MVGQELNPDTLRITTERFELRPLLVADAQGVMGIVRSEKVMQWTSQKPVENLEQAERWVSARAEGPGLYNFAIRERGSEAIVGILGSFHPPKIGYLIHPDHFGRGIATEALRAFIPAYFAHFPPLHASSADGYDHVEAWTDTTNLASQRVLQKCGFRKCAFYADDFANPNMGLRSSFVWVVPRPGVEWKDLKLSNSEEGLAEREDEEPPVPPVQ